MISNDEKLNAITKSLRSFIELALDKDEKSWAAWITAVAKETRVKCWEKNGCTRMDCPAYKSECGRCWLIAGSMCTCCSDETSGCLDDTTSCIDCEVYQANVSGDPYSEIQEHIITLVHNLRSRQIELKEMATHDSLTGLKNRHFFDSYMVHEMEKLKRGNVKDMVIIAMDINDFKDINDTWGHVVGDHMLKECSAILTNSIRASDVLFRFGGDEFLVVMAAAGMRESEILLQRIADNFEKWNSCKNEYDIKLSISIGCAMLTGKSKLLEVIAEADRMMYEEKQKHKVLAGQMSTIQEGLGAGASSGRDS